MKACSICGIEKEKYEFSTLARFGYNGKGDTESVACTSCHWMQLVTHHPSWSVDANGDAIVTYVAHDTPQIVYATQMKRLLPIWMRDPKVVSSYESMGDMKLQSKPFYDFVATLDKMTTSSLPQGLQPLRVFVAK